MSGQGSSERRGEAPIAVKEYRLGGYQLVKNWLSYRESKVLGRGLSVSEVSWWSEVARRIGLIL